MFDGFDYRSCCRFFPLAAVCLLGAATAAAADAPEVGRILTSHCDFAGRLRGEECLIVVPENRHEPTSRRITVHFFRFPAREPNGLPPLFCLTGGPDQCLLADDLQAGLRDKRYSHAAELAAFNRRRDVIVVNQRGASQAPGIDRLPSPFLVRPGKSSEPLSLADRGRREAEGFRTAVERCAALDIDLRGYDILHLVDDVDAIRRAYGYKTIALRGSSFGSQWALAYLRRYPERVDRMILSGVEPVDHGYDSADGVWNVFRRIEAQARESKDVELPEVGLLGAVEAVIARLERKPVRVTGRNPRRGYAAEVVIGADDFRHYLRRPILDSAEHSRQMLEWWPKFVLEVYREDYQYLAAMIIDDRPEYDRRSLLLTLVDNSLGVSDERRRRLEAEPARRWLGDLNAFYVATRELSPAPVVSDEFCRPAMSKVRVLLIQGTLDLATPLENATELLPFFPNGHLITVDGGTHAATYHAAGADPKFLEYLSTFMDAADPAAAAETLPSKISLPALRFRPIGEPTLFSELLRQGEPPAPR